VPGLAHAADHHAPLAAADQLHGSGEALVDARTKRAHRVGFDRQHPARDLHGAFLVDFLLAPLLWRGRRSLYHAWRV
jgi:hypothetical protein